MKKILSMLTLFIAVGFITPVLAAPNGHHGAPFARVNMAPMRGGVHHIQKGFYAPPPVRTHKPVYFYAGYPRRTYWRYPTYCDYRISRCNDYYFSYTNGMYMNNGIYIELGVPFF